MNSPLPCVMAPVELREDLRAAQSCRRRESSGSRWMPWRSPSVPHRPCPLPLCWPLIRIFRSLPPCPQPDRLDGLPSVVGRVSLNEDDLVIGALSPECAQQWLSHVSRLVACRHDDGHRRPLAVRLLECVHLRSGDRNVRQGRRPGTAATAPGTGCRTCSAAERTEASTPSARPAQVLRLHSSRRF